MSYATVAQLKAKPYLDSLPTGTGNDVALQAVLDRAYAIVNDALGFTFAAYGSSATDKDVRALGGQWLRLPAYKATSITGITSVGGRGTSNESETTVTDYLVDEDMRPYRIYRDDGWTRGYWYRIAAIWGYGAAPANVLEVELEVAANIWLGAVVGRGDSVGVEGQGAINVQRALTWGQRNILAGVSATYLGGVHA